MLSVNLLVQHWEGQQCHSAPKPEQWREMLGRVQAPPLPAVADRLSSFQRSRPRLADPHAAQQMVLVLQQVSTFQSWYRRPPQPAKHSVGIIIKPKP